MAGFVASAAGLGGITINIPIQFSVFAVNTRVITDGFTAAALADAISIPPEIVEAVKKTQPYQEAIGAASMLGEVIPTSVTNFVDGAWTEVSNVTDMVAQIQSSAEGLEGKLQGFVNSSMDTANGTIVTAMQKLLALEDSTATDVATLISDVSGTAYVFPNEEMGGVLQAGQAVDRFRNLVNQVQSTTSDVGAAIETVKNITANTQMITACATVAGAVASKCGLPPPPSIDEAFATLQNGAIGQHINNINTSLNVINEIASKTPYSGQGDDLNDILWQKDTLGTTGIVGDGTGITWPALPGFPAGKSVTDAMHEAKTALTATVGQAQAQIQAAMQPLMDLGNAVAGAANALGMPEAAVLNPDLLSLYESAFNSMSYTDAQFQQQQATQDASNR